MNETASDTCAICGQRPADYEGLLCYNCKDEADKERLLPAPFYSDDVVTLYHADARDLVCHLPPHSVDCVITSPPYFGKRAYTDRDSEIGRREKGFNQYIADMVDVFAPLKDVLAPDGNIFIVLGYGREKHTTQLLLAPEALAWELQKHGFILKDRITWLKFFGSPESVKSRLRSTTETILRLTTRSRNVYFNMDLVRRELAPSTIRRLTAVSSQKTPTVSKYGDDEYTGGIQNLLGRWARYIEWVETRPEAPTLPGFDITIQVPVLRGANPGDYWLHIDSEIGMATLAVAPAQSHFSNVAPFPEDLVAILLAIGCKPGGTVLDPFVGSGTTTWVAKRMGCSQAIGIDINERDLAEAAERCQQIRLC